MDKNIPVGVLQWVNKIAKSIRTTNIDAFFYMKECSPNFSNFIESYLNSRAKYIENISIDMKLCAQDVESLTGESHLGGTFVFLDKKSNLVYYSSLRANPLVFHEYSKWYCGELGIPIFSRSSINYNRVVAKKFILDEEIINFEAASVYAGYLIALAWFTSTTDLHSANVVFNGNTPIVIDDECVMHPLRDSQLSRLNNDRRHYPFSPFRSILFQEEIMGRRKAESGLASLISGGVSYRLLTDSFIHGCIFLKKNYNTLMDIAYLNAARDESIRYLMRGTEFYDSCISYICMRLYEGKGVLPIRGDIFLKFSAEMKLFPETACFVEHEIECLLSGEVPYFSARVADGLIRSGVSGNELGFVPAPNAWISRNINNASSWSDDQLRHAIFLGFQSSDFSRSQLPVFI